MQPINDWGTAIVSALALALSMVATAVPKIAGFLVILLVGWIIAWAIGTAVARLLRAVRFNQIGERSGFSRFIENMGVHAEPADVVAETAKWFVRLIMLVVAFDALGLPAVSQIFNQIVAWLPNLIVALMVLVLGGFIANVVSDLVRGSSATSGMGNPNFLANIARLALWGFAIIVAINQIGIATNLVNILFMGFVGALALATGLAFGLGGRDTAAEIWHDWYSKSREVSRRAQSEQRQPMAKQEPMMAKPEPVMAKAQMPQGNGDRKPKQQLPQRNGESEPKQQMPQRSSEIEPKQATSQSSGQSQPKQLMSQSSGERKPEQTRPTGLLAKLRRAVTPPWR